MENAQKNLEVIARINKQIGINFTKFRVDAGETQEDTATALSLSRVHYCNIENGRFLPSLITVMLFCHIYSVSVSDVIPKIEDL